MKFMISLLVSLTFLSNAIDASETAWVQHGDEARSRLIGQIDDISAKGQEFIWFAFEVKLAKGWKTYWRSPGEAGLPLVITKGKQPLELAYPIPERFELFGMKTFGYSDTVVIPFKLPKAGLAQTAKLSVSFMICKDICIPIVYETALPKKKVLNYKGLIQKWLEKVPTKGDSEDLSVLKHRIVGPVGKQRLILDVKGIEDLGTADVIVEGPEGVSFSKPIATKKGDFTRFVLIAKGAMKSQNLRGKKMRITVVFGTQKAIDITI